MTTGRINQIPSSMAGGAGPGGENPPAGLRPQGPPEKGDRHVFSVCEPGRGARKSARPRRGPRAYPGRAHDHPLTHTVKPSDGAVCGAGSRRVFPPRRGPTGCGIGPSCEGRTPREHAGERRIVAGRLPSGICCRMMVSDQSPTDPNSAGRAETPGLRSLEPPRGEGKPAGGCRHVLRRAPKDPQAP